ncbi:hypothetical protein Tco_1176054 [Tanacetum coccineum]
MQKNFGTPIAKYFIKTSTQTYQQQPLNLLQHSRNKTKYTTPRYNNKNQSTQIWEQRTMTFAGIGNTVAVQNAGSPKRKDYAITKEKMMICKQAEQGVPLQADWLEDTDEEIDEQELESNIKLHDKDSEVSLRLSSTGRAIEHVHNHD